MRAHLGIFLGALALLTVALPSWCLHTVLIDAVVARAVVIWCVLAVSVASLVAVPESTQSGQCFLCTNRSGSANLLGLMTQGRMIEG